MGEGLPALPSLRPATRAPSAAAPPPGPAASGRHKKQQCEGQMVKLTLVRLCLRVSRCASSERARKREPKKKRDDITCACLWSKPVSANQSC